MALFGEKNYTPNRSRYGILMSSIENVAFHEEGESHEEEKVPKLKEANTPRKGI